MERRITRIIEFADPLALALLVPVVVGLAIGLVRARGSAPGVLFPSIGILPSGRVPLRARLGWLALLIRCVSLGLLVLAVARPQLVIDRADVLPEGIDIVLATDVSGSMSEATFGGVTKIDAVRRDSKTFVSGLKNDRVGLVIFAGEAAAIGPLTLDYRASGELIDRFVSTDSSLAGGTAIGTGLASAINLLRDSVAHSQVVILLTDGENNSGDITPLDAANIASLVGVRVYTIGAVGAQANPNSDTVDELVMRRMAELTGGQYFRADDVEGLLAIYNAIDALEKSRVDVRTFVEYQDVYLPFLAAGAALLFLEVVLGATVLRRTP